MLIFDFLFPNRCLECNQLIDKDEVICEICLAKVNFTHHDFSANNSLRDKVRLTAPVEHAYALLYYEKGSLAQHIIHALKYNHREKIGKILATWVSERIDFKDCTPDLIITVPLHPRKLKQRGYNQLSFVCQ